jgi:hypothetical protein
MKKLASVLGIIVGTLLALSVLMSAFENFPQVFAQSASSGFVYVGAYVFTYFVMFGLCARWAYKSWKVIAADKDRSDMKHLNEKILDSDLDNT